jgi:hypothetical protein
MLQFVAATLFWLFLTVSRHQLIIYLSFVSFQVLILLFNFFPCSKENQIDEEAFVRIPMLNNSKQYLEIRFCLQFIGR